MMTDEPCNDRVMPKESLREAKNSIVPGGILENSREAFHSAIRLQVSIRVNR